MFGCLPLFHTFGQTVALNSTFLVGGTLILRRGSRRRRRCA